MAKQKVVIARGSADLAKVLGLPPSAAHEWLAKSDLTTALSAAVQREGLTHAEVARRAKTSRTRITSILNRNLRHVTTDLLIRILGALGYTVKLSVSRMKVAA